MFARYAVAAALLAACGGAGGGRASTTLAHGKPLRLVSADRLCGSARGRRQLSAALAPRELVMRIMCNESYQGELYKQLYASFDERMFGHLTAALMIVNCVGEGACDVGPRRSPLALGTLDWFARRVNGPRVLTILQSVNIPEQMRQDFLDRLAAATRQVRTLAAGLDPRRRELYVALPQRIRDQREQDRTRTFAEIYKRFGLLGGQVEAALKARAATPALVAKARALRDDWMRACEAAGRDVRACLAGPIARPLTELLVRLAIALKDPVLGHAENTLLELRSDRTRVQMEIYLAQQAAMAAERARLTEYADAARQGVDRRTLAATTGAAPPVDLGREQAWRMSGRIVSYRVVLERLGKPVVWLHGQVQTIARGGEWAQLRLRSPDSDKQASVRVPAAEVRHLRQGQWLAVVADQASRTGLVIDVRENAAVTSKVLQRRGFALAAAGTLAQR